MVAAKIPIAMQRRLGCLEEPRSIDILARIHEDREAATGEQEWASRIVALVAACRRERRAVAGFAREQICYVGGHGWVAPTDVLVGASLSTALDDLPVVKGPAGLVEALAALGASRRPLPSHWARAVRVATTPYTPGTRLPKPSINHLRRLYGRLAVLGIGDIDMGPGEDYLLSTAGTLHIVVTRRPSAS